MRQVLRTIPGFQFFLFNLVNESSLYLTQLLIGFQTSQNLLECLRKKWYYQIPNQQDDMRQNEE